ncbi:hypothetical protein NIES4073_59660 [Kalymmatonema gypsitolerans NIES-4073]|nr:hypothetical protein NIES4073_59660 [Scytonema sp. NIES-4073]
MISSAYLGLLFFIAFLEINRKKENHFDFLTLFNIIFALMYPLPAFVLDADFAARAELSFRSTLYISNPQTALAIFLGYFFVIIGFYSSDAQKYGKFIFIETRSDNFVTVYAVLLLLFSCVSIQIYSSQYGNFLYAISNAGLIRAGAATEEGGALGFFKHLMLFSIFSSYLFGSFVLSKKFWKWRLILYTTFLISVVIAVVTCLMEGSRMILITYFLVWYLVWVLKTGRLSLQFTIPVLCFIALFLLYGKPIAFSLTALPDGYVAVWERFQEYLSNQPDSGFNFYKFMGNFVYPIHSLDAAINTQYNMRLFLDWLYAFATILPERLLNVDVPDTITVYNTEYIVGPVDYSIPPGFLAFGFYSLSWAGVIIVCLTYGWIGRYLQTIFKNNIHAVPWMPFIYVLTAKLWIDFQTAGDPRVFIMFNLWCLLSTLPFFFIASKISISKNKNKKRPVRKSCVHRY